MNEVVITKKSNVRDIIQGDLFMDEDSGDIYMLVPVSHDRYILSNLEGESYWASSKDWDDAVDLCRRFTRIFDKVIIIPRPANQ